MIGLAGRAFAMIRDAAAFEVGALWDGVFDTGTL